MTKLNQKGAHTSRGPLQTTDLQIPTFEGGKAFARTQKGELFALGVNLLDGADTFYETAADRDKRFIKLVTTIAVVDPEWMTHFLGWLRNEGNIRTASIKGAVHAVEARLNDFASVEADKNGMVGWNRLMISVVCQRADEPGEVAAYWQNTFGRMPQPVKRGLADAIVRLTSEYSYMKYGDQAGASWSIPDLVEMLHPRPQNVYQEALFGYAIAKSHGNEYEGMASLPMIQANRYTRAMVAERPEALLDAGLLKSAGMTWEDALSLAGNRVDKKALWEAMIPSMGIFALVRNLRNFEEAGINAASVRFVCDKLENPEVIAKSRMFPYRFYTAYKNLKGLKFVSSLEVAMGLSVSNVPELPGRTLVLCDVSRSMESRMSQKSDMSYVEAAAIYALALALKNPGKVKLVGFATHSFTFNVPVGGSILKLVADFMRTTGQVGGGTETSKAAREHFNKHDQVFVITDMQAFSDYGNGHSLWGEANTDVSDVIPDSVPLFGFSLGGYKPAMKAGIKNRHELSGLSDATFKMVPLLLRGRDAKWPWEN